ncbi:Gfo/Idh/MocA family oxidoreductase [Streptomyces sp. H28]|uniref:Gfo/Idh/MocA family protein n=1 Tax=Streptomyces sp. H28 TaxID=2775865 RepID=UPI001781B9EC|nr:Gfo/Idh/MocA family oxidoreductase [Streptomyces sp. H28]MBD9732672.1 Gfo/Idh/MocA family oxidoreductase [Streptomyces sp. H28]
MSAPGRASQPLRIGVLGAARITERALVGPARAEAFAAAHGVERVLGSYAELLADPEVEVVYNPLANGLHGPYNLAALAAGKHVLTEKPSASNAGEAREVREAAARAGTVFMEGFHYLFHPVTRRLHELLASGALGTLRHAEALVAIPAPDAGDPRWSLSLAGGALMDLGCYGLHALRRLAPWAGGAPLLVSARAGERAGAPGVDEWLYADLEYPGGATGTVRCHMAYGGLEMSLRVVGTRGEARAANFVLPHLDDRVVVRTGADSRTERLGTRSSYAYQLEAFADAVRRGTRPPLDADDALATMTLVDACYRAAGLSARPRTVPGR